MCTGYLLTNTLLADFECELILWTSMPKPAIMQLSNFLVFYVKWLALASVGTFLVFWWDKFQARNRGWRVSNLTLLWLAFLGGWPGACLAIPYLRHKSKQTAFQVKLALTITLHVLSLVLFVRYTLLVDRTS
jgi:uncharacterized membrane protein YsdA (DUF1294 family)